MGMRCRGCGEANRDGARFCASCGDRLLARCGACDAELPAGARFCDECGAPVDASGVPDPTETKARKVVTVVFADLAGSTAMHEDMDPESVRAFNDRYYAAMQATVEAHGGRIVKFVGDGVMAAFGVPEVAEDDARRALAAALDMAAVRAGVRVGVNTGEVVVDEDDHDVVGDAVNVAARLEGAAPVGGVLVGGETYRLTRDHATFGDPRELHVKGRQEPVVARVLVGLGHTGDDGTAGFVGRDAELGQLVDAVARVEATGRAQLVAVVGSPGVGKSRLLAELEAAVRDTTTVLVGRCDAAGGPTFDPVVDVVRRAVDVAGAIDDDVAAAVAFLLGDGEPGTPERTFWGVRRAVEAAARVRPIVLVLDDAHWAEPLLLDLVEHLAEWLGDTRVLLVVAGRPELRELRPALVEVGARAAAVLALEGLDADATRRLTAELLGAGGLPPAVATRVVDATEGNPLFVRELVRMLVDDGVLRADGDGWALAVDEADIDVPPTITALLAARIERLRADERTVLERASVLGHEVVRGALADLVPAPSRAQLDTVLESLRRKELLEPAGAYWIDEPVLRFHHALIRDASYRRVLRAARAELHERAAAWFVGKTRGGADHDELIGFHLEQAQANLRELGDLDDRGRSIAADAARRLGAAAHRALHRDDLPAAGALAGRAIACLDAGDRARAELLLVRAEALLGTGDVVAARPAVDELASTAGGDERLEAWATAFAVQLATLTGTADLGESEALAQGAADRLAVLGDHTGAAKAHRARASVLARLGRVADAETALDRALTEARQAGDQRQISGVLAAAPQAALWGPSPVARAGGRCLDVVRLLRITTGAREVEAISKRCQAVLEALRGRFGAARKMVASARRSLEDLGLRNALLELELDAGIVELVAGDVHAADAHFGIARAGFAALGAEVDAAQAASLQARAALRLGDAERALALADTAERLGGRDLKTAITWRAVKAEVLAARREGAAAVELASAAVALAEPTDALVDKADALAALATVLSLTGDVEGGRAARERARALYEAKGAAALAGRDGPVAPPPRPSAPGANGVVRHLLASQELLFAGRWEEFRDTMAPDCVLEDRRPLSTERVQDRDRIVEGNRVVFELGLQSEPPQLVATAGDDIAVVRLAVGNADFRDESLFLLELDRTGRTTRVIQFPLDDVDGAVAELARRAPGTIENRAVRVLRAGAAAMLAGDWDAYVANQHPEFVNEDRRPGPHVRLQDRVQQLASARAAVELGVTAVDFDVVATRGDDLAVVALHVSGRDGFRVDSLMVIHSDESERMRRVVELAHDDLDAALAHLDERYEATLRPELRATVAVGKQLNAAFSLGDPAAFERVLAPGFRYVDRFPVGLGELGRDELIAAAPALGRERTYLLYTTAVLALGERGGVFLMREDDRNDTGGEVRQEQVTVVLVAGGLVERIENFPGDQRAAAVARFEELTS